MARKVTTNATLYAAINSLSAKLSSLTGQVVEVKSQVRAVRSENSGLAQLITNGSAMSGVREPRAHVQPGVTATNEDLTVSLLAAWERVDQLEAWLQKQGSALKRIEDALNKRGLL